MILDDGVWYWPEKDEVVLVDRGEVTAKTFVIVALRFAILSGLFLDRIGEF